MLLFVQIKILDTKRCKEGAGEEGAVELMEEGTQHLATHVYILAIFLLLQSMLSLFL